MTAVLRRPVLDSEAVARQGAMLAGLARPVERPLTELQVPDALVDTINERLGSLDVPLHEALGLTTVASVTTTEHPPLPTLLAFDLAAGGEPLAILYLDRACVDRLVAVQCGMAQPTSRAGRKITPFEAGMATAFARSVLRAASRDTDACSLTLRKVSEPEVDAASDATIELRTTSRGMVGDVIARARIQLTEAGAAALAGEAAPARATSGGLSVAPVRLKAAMSVPKLPLASIRRLRVGQTLRLGPDAQVQVLAGRRRFAFGSLQTGTGQRAISITAFTQNGPSKS